ncbi:26S proteasome non-ATPase regulatory subunit 5 [Agrilus planipennis]|uniref:26S proteasome non-ATPase regulatory subunit 5 n=1 Tax=Agrilus planipennis TaxID=224129 RepID=A0A1W4XNE5_AGRPL|nr:26S proteasome non-ATPase regulatory subunit 5 [Agrilus planipennis]
MSRQEWCSDKLSKLLHDDSRIPVLHEIKEHLSELPFEEAVQTAKEFELPLVFDCLNNSNSDQINLACEVLSLCMSKLSLGESIDRYCVPLERALNHPNPSVKLMALMEIHRNALDEEIHCQLCRKQSLLESVVKCLGDDDLGVVKNASDVILLLSSTPTGIRQLTSSEMLNAIGKTMSINEVIKLRFYEVFVHIAAESDGTQRLLESTGLMSQILTDLENTDVLLRINVIEILSKLVVTEHGYKYLESQGVFQKLFQYFNEGSDQLSLQLCEPGILRFFGHMAYWKPTEVLSKYQVPLNRLFHNLESSDFPLVAVSFDILGHIGETNEGKVALDTAGDRKVLRAVEIVRERLGSLPNEVKLRAMSFLENLFRMKDSDPKISNLIQKWFNKLGDDGMDFVFKYVKNPFSEIRLAGLGILNSLCGHHWGQENIKNTPGLVEFLLDRRVETMKECKEATFDIIYLLSSSPVFDKITQLRLQAFVKEGPFHVQAITEVAIEGD